MTFAQRSYQKELLDRNDIPFDDIKQNMKELDFINTWLGGHKITIDGFKALAGRRKNVSVCEIGCGGGDNLAAIYNNAVKNQIAISITGIDIKPECIDLARSKNEAIKGGDWIANDYRKVDFTTKPDIIFSSLFCHHFTNEELATQLRWMRDNSNVGFFINDLHRHPLAYYSIKTLTQLFSSSYLVKNDAPISVARGFTKPELENICSDAGLDTASVVWKWAFRFLLLYKHEQQPSI